MAFANQNQGFLVPIHQVIDLRSVTFVPGPPIGLINPSNGPPLLPQFGPSNSSFVGPVGFTLNPVVLLRIDERRTRSLLQFMVDEGLVPSPEEEMRRKNAIDKLKQIVTEWVRKVAYKRGLRKPYAEEASAEVLTYGSYGLGVHNSESDIDALCVGPRFATMADDFFSDLQDILASRPEVSEIHCVKDAKVPLMRFKLDGISIDLPYAKLNVMSVPENVDILNPYFLRNIDETSWRSLSGVHANKCILRLLPDPKVFQALLRCVKLWAKRRGLYGNLLGFLGGVHLAILAAFICQRHPNVSLNGLVSSFFKTFAHWPWPTPVVMDDGMLPRVMPCEVRSYLPIRLPCRPQEYCHSNITRSTFDKIQRELLRGYQMTSKDPLNKDIDWACLFEVFPYTKRYTRFVKICLSASDKNELGEWVGWVKSRFRGLLLKLEEMQGYCDPNPTEYVDPNIADPNVVFYWGLQGRSGFINMMAVKDFFNKSTRNGYRGYTGKVTMSIVNAQDLPKNAQFDGEGDKVSKSPGRTLDIDHQAVGCLTTNMNTEYPSGGG